MKKTSFNEDQVEVILDVFRRSHKGRQNAIKTEKILFELSATGKATLLPQTFRDMIGYIRNNDLCAPGFIVSTVHEGYWMTIDKQEQNDFLDQQLNRMSNQYDNLKALHTRLRYGKGKAADNQPSLFG